MEGALLTAVPVEFDLAIIFGVVVGTAVLSRATQIPITALEIVAGIVLANVFLFQIPSSVGSLVTLGSLLIVFLAGFETNFDFLLEHARRAMLFGLAGFALPCAGLFFVLYGVAHAPLLVSVIGATALADTSISIVYTTLHQYELADLPFGRLVLAGTLAVNLLEDATVTTTTFVTAPALFFALAVLAALLLAALFLPRLSAWIHARFRSSFANVETRALLLSLAVLAALSTLVRAPGILFVFLMGLLFSRYSSPKFLRDVRNFAFALFVPLYFLAVGLKVDFGSVAANLGLLGLLLAAGTGLKLAGLLPVARRAFGAERAAPVAVLMNTRLTSATVILLLSLTLGLLSAGWYSILIAAVVVLALASTLALRAFPAFRNPAAARATFGVELPFSPETPAPAPALPVDASAAEDAP
jgi:Kef-type K+ transport system membrane component KefB